MAPSMAKKSRKEKKERKSVGAKSKVAKKATASSRDEVERSLRIADMLLEQEEVVHSEDEGMAEDEYIRTLKVDRVAVDEGDGGFEVDMGEEGFVKVKAGEAKAEVVDTREKRPKVANSLRSLRLAIAEKAKKMEDDRRAKLLAKGGFESDDEEK